MGIEFEVMIEVYSQYTGVPFQGQYGVIQSDSRMCVRLRELWGEWSDGGLWSRNGLPTPQ